MVPIGSVPISPSHTVQGAKNNERTEGSGTRLTVTNSGCGDINRIAVDSALENRYWRYSSSRFNGISAITVEGISRNPRQ